MKTALTVVAAVGASWAVAGIGTWTTSGPSGSILAVAVDASTPSTVYAGGFNIGVFKSSDGGASWTSFGLGSHSVLALAVAATTPATVYAGTNAQGVFTSSTTGINWIVSGLMYNSVQALAVAPAAPLTVFAGTNVNGVSKSTDGGGTWVKSGLGNYPVPALAIDPMVANTIYAATGGGVFKSTDGGISWTLANGGMGGITVRAFAIDATHQGTLYAATGSAGVFKSSDGGTNWAAVNSGLTNLTVNAIGISTSSPPKVYAGTSGGGVFMTSDGGQSWTALVPGLTNLTVNALAVTQTTPTTVYAGTGNGVFSYTEPVVCAVPSGFLNNTATDPDPCAKTGVTVAWSVPTTWGDSGVGLRTFAVLRNGIPIATGIPESTHVLTDTTAVAFVPSVYAVRASNGCGLTATTLGATASDTPSQPAITRQPASATIWAGQRAVLTVEAVLVTEYQWYAGSSGDTSQPIAGATSSQYVTAPLSSNASFWVRISNACGSIASDTASITLNRSHVLRRHLTRVP